MAEVWVSPEEVQAALAALPPGATTEDYVSALQGAASMAIVKAELEAERAQAETLAGLAERINELKAAHDADRRERNRPEVDRYLRLLRRRR